MARMSKTAVIVLIVVGLLLCGVVAVAIAGFALFMPVREEISVVPDRTTSPAPPTEAATPDEPLTIEDEAELVADALRGAHLAHVTGVDVVIRLRRPVIVVSSDVGPEQAGLSDEVSSALVEAANTVVTPAGDACTFYLELRSSEGDVLGAASSTDERWKLATPPAPADASGLRDWLDAAYGAGSTDPEAWVARITGVEADSGSADGFLVVRTDLDQNVPDDLLAAQTIIDAVDSSGATFTPGVRVLFADGSWEWSSMLTGVDPFTGAATP